MSETHNAHGRKADRGRARAVTQTPKQIRKRAYATIERLAQKELTPLDVMLGVMIGKREFANYSDRQLKMAVEAAPYCHPKLQAIAFKQAPDDGAERRRQALSALSYDQRRAILATIESVTGVAAGDASDAVAVEIEGEAEDSGPSQDG